VHPLVVADQALGTEFLEEVEAAERVAANLDGVAGEDQPVGAGREAAVFNDCPDDARFAVDVR